MSFDKPDNEDGTFPQKFRGRERNVSAAVARIEREMRDFIPEIVRGSGESAKVIALFADTTPRTVENWGDGQCLPSAPRLIVLAAKYPALRQKVNEWMDAIAGESGKDPNQILRDVYHYLADHMK